MKKFYALSLILCLYALPAYSCYEMIQDQSDEYTGTMFDLSLISPLFIENDSEYKEFDLSKFSADIDYKPADFNSLEPLFETSSTTSSTESDEKLERSFIKAFIRWIIQLGSESADKK